MTVQENIISGEIVERSPRPLDAVVSLHGDCLNLLPALASESVDMVLCDLPYGITANKWDSVIPLANLWEQYERIIKPTGVIALTASQPFSSMLVMSNPKLFRHEWIWIKNKGGNFANTVREPFKEHEQILIFSRGNWTYNKQMQDRTGGGLARVKYKFNAEIKTENYGKFNNRQTERQGEKRVPSSWQKFNTDTSGLHPTIKPTALMEYLIKTYTNENEVVLDNCMGSGTTGIACINTGRRFIGMEKEEKYFVIASKRIADALNAVSN